MSLPCPDDNKDFTMETREASPAHFLIKIESFSLLSECGIKKYETRVFEAGGYKWKLIIYPDGHESELSDGNHVSVYLAMSGTSSLPVGWELGVLVRGEKINFKETEDTGFLTLVNTLIKGKVRRFHAMQSEWGFSKMISKNSLKDESNGFLVDDNCVFGAEVFVIERQQVVECVSVLKVTNPFKRDWMIENFSKLEDVWTSEEFTAGDCQWKIELYPDGDKREKGRSVSIFLHCVDSKSFAPNEKVRADFSIQIKNSLHSTDDSGSDSIWFTSSCTGYGWPDFIPIAEMRERFIVDDCCFLEIEISVRAVVRNPPSTPK